MEAKGNAFTSSYSAGMFGGVQTAPTLDKTYAFQEISKVAAFCLDANSQAFLTIFHILRERLCDLGEPAENSQEMALLNLLNHWAVYG